MILPASGLAPSEQQAIAGCMSRLTKGRAMLDPLLGADKLVTRWRLWIPENWKAGVE